MSSQNIRRDAPSLAPNLAPADDPKAEGDLVRELPLRGERTLRLIRSGADELVEVRAASGLLELRLRMTPEGPVLQMESVRISLSATEAVDVKCKSFTVDATDSLDLHSGGGMRVSGEADVRVDASGEVHVKGKMIHLN
jgi:hypothetical protein